MKKYVYVVLHRAHAEPLAKIDAVDAREAQRIAVKKYGRGVYVETLRVHQMLMDVRPLVEKMKKEKQS